MRSVLLQLLLVCAASAAVLDRIAVVVGNDVITEGEVEDALRLDQFLASQPLDLSPQKRYAEAQRLADQQLIRHEMEVARYKLPDPGEADAMLRNFRQQHFRSDAEFQAALQKYGITDDQLKQHLLWQLAVLRFTDTRFGGNAPQGETQSASRATPEPRSNQTPPPGAPSVQSPDRSAASPPSQSADRLAPGASPASGQTDVDQQLDAFLREARSSTRVVFKKEAFQ